MKTIIFLSLFLPFIGKSQLTDTTCVQSKWIALKPIEVNKDIFQLDASDNNSFDLVKTIKRLVESNKLKIYNQIAGPKGNQIWNYIDYNSELEHLSKDDLNIQKNPYFEITTFIDLPLPNQYGEDSIVINPDGTILTVYPTPKTYVFPAKECDEIRIKEDRVFNKSTKQYEFKPVGLSFYFNDNNIQKEHEMFWVDLNDLFSVLDNKNQYPWYNAIVNKKYQGFQYMQVSCYEDEIKE